MNLVLRNIIASDRFPPALLFCGQKGSGRASAAREFAYAASCDGDPKPCHQCVSCRANDFGEGCRIVDVATLFADETEKNRTASFRDILARHRQTHQLRRCIAIIESAPLLNETMQAAMLKAIEEPCPGVSYVLIVESPDDVTATIRSRALSVRFPPPVSGGDVKEAEKFLLSPPPRGSKRNDILEKLGKIIPVAAAAKPAWREALLDLDRAVDSNAHVGLSFAHFRARVR